MVCCRRYLFSLGLVLFGFCIEGTHGDIQLGPVSSVPEIQVTLGNGFELTGHPLKTLGVAMDGGLVVSVLEKDLALCKTGFFRFVSDLQEFMDARVDEELSALFNQFGKTWMERLVENNTQVVLGNWRVNPHTQIHIGTSDKSLRNLIFLSCNQSEYYDPFVGFKHEVVHVLAREWSLPQWLEEGLAYWVEHRSGSGIVHERLDIFSRLREIPPLFYLGEEPSIQVGRRPIEDKNVYAISFLLINYMVRNFGGSGFLRDFFSQFRKNSPANFSLALLNFKKYLQSIDSEKHVYLPAGNPNLFLVFFSIGLVLNSPNFWLYNGHWQGFTSPGVSQKGRRVLLPGQIVRFDMESVVASTIQFGPKVYLVRVLKDASGKALVLPEEEIGSRIIDKRGRLPDSSDLLSPILQDELIVINYSETQESWVELK